MMPAEGGGRGREWSKEKKVEGGEGSEGKGRRGEKGRRGGDRKGEV